MKWRAVRCANSTGCPFQSRCHSATCSGSAHVRQYVKSASQTRSGAGTVKSWFSRSSARTPSLAGIVVRTADARQVCTASMTGRCVQQPADPANAGPYKAVAALLLKLDYIPLGELLINEPHDHRMRGPRPREESGCCCRDGNVVLHVLAMHRIVSPITPFTQHCCLAPGAQRAPSVPHWSSSTWSDSPLLKMRRHQTQAVSK